MKDFLIFCRLAVENGVIPPGWSWSAFLTKAANHLRYAFEKSDAQQKYGAENVFQAMMGGRSLRHTGEVVYGSSCQNLNGPSDLAGRITNEVQGSRGGPTDALCLSVGGGAIWRGLAVALSDQWLEEREHDSDDDEY